MDPEHNIQANLVACVEFNCGQLVLLLVDSTVEWRILREKY